MSEPEDLDLLRHPADVARALLGVTLRGPDSSIVIVETEAYAFDDPASHSFTGQTIRNQSMFAAAGTLYVYRSYGVHWCANVVTGAVGEGSAVLLRAGIPVGGEAKMAERRRRSKATDLCSGPGKLASALGITGDHDGSMFVGPDRGPFELIWDSQHAELAGVEPESIRLGPRVGISRGVEALWRFAAGDPQWMSRPKMVI
jgi:DNA-3-methyladenine glycosylase